MDLRQLRDMNQVNDGCTEFPEPQLQGTCHERSARPLGFRVDIFRNNNID